MKPKKDRARDLAESRLKLEGNARAELLRITCERHKGTTWVKLFERDDSGHWFEVESRSATQAREVKEVVKRFEPQAPTGNVLDDWLGSIPPLGQLQRSTSIVWQYLEPDEPLGYQLVTISCEACSDNLERRESVLFPVFDYLVAKGLSQISLTALRKACELYDSNRTPGAEG